MQQDATWYGARPQPRGLCVRWGPKPHPQKGAEPPNFWPVFTVAKRLDGSGWHLAWRWPQPRRLLLGGDQLPLPYMGTAPNFRPMSVVAKRLDGLRWHLVWR